ncbi:MAG: efflux RND transporter periplasmic adaptor subunit [Verrucomicrobiales bacterium]
MSQIAKESEMATITLTADAVKRLGIVTVPVEKKKVVRTRTFGGDVLIALGRAAASPSSAQGVSASIFSLLPAITPAEMIRVAEMQTEADGQIAAVQVQLEAAQTAHSRAETLLASKAGSARSLDEAKAQVALAETQLRSAQTRRELLGASLFAAVKQNSLWIRVPVYAGTLAEIKRGAEARVGGLADKPGAATQSAKAIDVPLSASSGSTTVDMYYEIDNQDGLLRPGQKVSVTLTLEGEDESLVVPWAAVLHDIHGGNWVYEQTVPNVFSRRRVQVRHVAGSLAVLASGPKVGALIVTAGAAELFGTEVGFGK